MLFYLFTFSLSVPLPAQVDVLESQYWQLIEEIGKTRDYQHLASTHHNFLVSITAQCFLNNQMVSNALQRLLKLIHNFCTIMETTWSSDSKRVPRFDSTSSSEQSSITDRAKQIREFSEAFERAAAQLFLILSNLKLHQGSQYTSQLIMRIDYNKFCSKSATVRRFTSPLEVEQPCSKEWNLFLVVLYMYIWCPVCIIIRKINHIYYIEYDVPRLFINIIICFDVRFVIHQRGWRHVTHEMKGRKIKIHYHCCCFFIINCTMFI